jgi:hypothetical protein
LCVAGKQTEAIQIYGELKKNAPQLPATVHVLINGYLGNFDEAFNRFEQAFIDRDFWMVSLKYLQDWDPLRTDPRFNNVLKRMKFPE